MASNYTPAAFDNVLSVSALADFDGIPGGLGAPTCRTDQDDTLADFSNWGSAVDIAAPGVCIYSTYPLERGEYGTLSGTSMASPHVAGGLALLASSNKPNNAADVDTLYGQLKDAGNTGWTDDSGDGIREPLQDVSNTTTFSPILVPVTVVPPAGITLSVKAYKIKSAKYAELAWNKTTSANVDVHRNGSVVVTTANDGAYTDKPPKTVTSATYKVCEAGTTTCSNEVTVTW
jgi:subtilisin family serine protease